MRTLTRHPWLLFLGSLVPALAGAAQVEIAEELERLRALHGFTLRGIEQTRDQRGHVGGETLAARLRLLLERFDYVMVQSPAGGVERLIILGEKTAVLPPPPTPAAATPPALGGEIVLATERVGASHAVTADLEGNGGKRQSQRLLIDTGADQVVLPASLIPALGIANATLRDQQVQTANGQVDARLGMLPALWLGGRRLAEVPVAFIADDRLGGNALLGMSVLGRFRLVIDENNQQVRLQPPEQAAPASR